jgi:predicted RNA-binding protein YlxR (DUF448 family)
MMQQATMRQDDAASARLGGSVPRAPSQRRCIATRREGRPEDMLRFVVAADGTVVPDLARKLPGRGIWVAADSDALRTACEKNLFARAARRQTSVPADLVARTHDLVRRRCLDLLGLARRAGQCVAGAEKVREALAKGQVGVLIVASDAAERGADKMQSAAGGVATIDRFSGDELGQVFGRDRTVHVAVSRGRLAEQLLTEARRLAGLRGAQILGNT